MRAFLWWMATILTISGFAGLMDAILAWMQRAKARHARFRERLSAQIKK